MNITDLYQRLFGKNHIRDGDVISMSEHGRAGGVSTGQGYKVVKDVAELMKVDAVDSSTTYIGRANHGTATSSAAWQIQKITVSGTATTIAYANASDNYDQVWDDRASLSYS